MRSLRLLITAQKLCARLRQMPAVEPHGARSQLLRAVHTSSSPGPPKSDPPKTVAPFEDAFAKDQRDKASFVQVLDMFCGRDVRRRGHVEMIEAALRWMPHFGVEKDIEVYNKLLDVFPKEVFIPRNFIQTMFLHYPRQQECAIRVLDQMEYYGVTPNRHTYFLLAQTFGKLSHPVKKYQRMMYWFPRFKHINPYPVPVDLEADPVALSKVCLARIAADRDAQVTVYQLPSSEVCEDGTVQEHQPLVGIQSPDQIALLAEHDPKYPVIVEGPFPLWLKKICVQYYVLRAEPAARKKEELDPERCFYYPLQLDLDLERDLGDDHSFNVDEVEEGPVYAMCMAGSGDERMLGKWIQCLQEANPVLGQLPVLFRLTSGPQEVSLPAQEEAKSAKEEARQSPTEEEEEMRQHRRMEQ
ncbi:evolutionarily conserved signaling intermediate in Toll pathway, mitochondrial [Hyla sarda]|uniref:evolutionarily conserved signaling intermediate in Toll pathway, mitochondrial n=1 Tax=Hyla sarda TaxID=327740 RepID=UPI0024C381B4|nr:evolutionarily conserved signaling intermediate in Toll pathway, mitochondrial [Hyla sarda]XP_056426394.1 evolutionarily conserved signaling intermediate in Toll pathway, mitochondrial [Hyla sarda]